MRSLPAVLASIASLMSVAAAVEPPSLDAFDVSPRAQAMVLGVFHFHQTDNPDVSTADRQREVGDVVDRLGAFKPTIIGLECTEAEEADINAAYAAWRAGAHDLTKNERQQLGFRLAAESGLDRVDCIDAPFPPAPTFDALGDDWDAFLAYAKERGEDVRYAPWLPRISAYFEEIEAFKREATVGEILDFMNGPDADYSLGRMLLIEVGVGVDDEWYGADWLGRFEGRNIRMFAKTQALATPDDRVLLIVGNAHKRPLERMFRDSFEFDVAETPDLR